MIENGQTRDGRIYLFLRDRLETDSFFNRSVDRHLQEVIPAKPGLLVDTPTMRYFGVGNIYTPHLTNPAEGSLEFHIFDLINPQSPQSLVQIKIGEISRLLTGIDLWKLSKELGNVLAYKFYPSLDVAWHTPAREAYQDHINKLLEKLTSDQKSTLHLGSIGPGFGDDAQSYGLGIRL